MTDAGVDTAALEAYLSAELGAAVVDTEVLHDGVNISLWLSTADGAAYVLRRPNALRQLPSFNERGMAPFTTEPGSPRRRDLVERYEDRTGIAVEHDRFYLAFAAFTLATVWESLTCHRSGADKEPYVEYMALLADSTVDGEFRLSADRPA